MDIPIHYFNEYSIVIVFIGKFGKAVFIQTRIAIYVERSNFNHIPTLIVLGG